jgi:hypothetical protein
MLSPLFRGSLRSLCRDAPQGVLHVLSVVNIFFADQLDTDAACCARITSAMAHAKAVVGSRA